MSEQPLAVDGPLVDVEGLLRVVTHLIPGTTAGLALVTESDVVTVSHEAVVVPPTVEERLRAGEPSVEAADALGDARVRHFAIRSDAELIGVLSVARPRADERPDDLARLADVARLARSAIELARANLRLRTLALADREARDLSAITERLARSLATAVTRSDVRRLLLLEIGTIGLGREVQVAFATDGRLRVDTVREGRRSGASRRLDLDDPHPLARAHRIGDLVRSTDNAPTGSGPRTATTGELTAAPMLHDGVSLGALAVRAPTSEVDVRLLLRVAELTAGALARGEHLERSEAVSQLLSRALRPPSSPQLAGYRTDAALAMSDTADAVGGDWYDVMVRDDRAVIVLGDVVGHDLEAARAATRLRFALAALLDEHRDDPIEALVRLERHVAAIGMSRPASLLVCTLDAPTGRTEIISMGHPAPLLVRRRVAGSVDVDPVPPLGTLGLRPRATTLQLAAGDRLVLFSDGVVERRDEVIDDGIARLAGLAATASADELVEINEALDDDATVVVVERDHDGESRRLSVAYPAELASVTAARRAVEALLDRHAPTTPSSARTDVMLVVSELVANAVEATPDGRGPIHLEVVVEDRRLRVEVVNDAAGSRPTMGPPGPPEARRGRGLRIVDAVSSQLTWRVGPPVTVIATVALDGDDGPGGG